MTTARMMLVVGPAREIRAESRRGFSKLKGSNWTGFPQPKRKSTSMAVPRGDRWANGFRVRRPWERGVGSPRRSAVKAWAASWKEMARSRETTQAMKRTGLVKRVLSI